MALVVKFDGKSFSLKSIDGAKTYDVTPAQTQSWQTALQQQAQQLGFADTRQMLEKVTVTVPTAGDSQYKIAGQFIADEPVANEMAAEMVAGNTQFENPDLIQAYHAGDLRPDFVVVPIKPEVEVPPSNKNPDGPVPPDSSTKPALSDQEKKTIAINALKNPSAQPDERKTAIAAYLDGHNGSVDERTKAAIELLNPNENYGKEEKVRTPKRQQILDVLVEPYKDDDTKKKVFDSLLEHTWTSNTGVSDKSMDQLIGQHAKDAYRIECDPEKWNR